jgi:hypothetical protein
MALYTVEVTYDMVVSAADVEDARSVAQEHAREAIGDLSVYDLGYFVMPLTANNLPQGYDDDSGVYGSILSLGELKCG